MAIRISRWGNSLGIRLPKEALDRAHLREGDVVSVEPTTRGLLVRRSAPGSLGDLVAAITPENLHGEIATGPPVGKEVW